MKSHWFMGKIEEVKQELDAWLSERSDISIEGMTSDLHHEGLYVLLVVYSLGTRISYGKGGGQNGASPPRVDTDFGPAPVCDLCGEMMVLRYRKSDDKPFWGCSTFPTCKRLLNIELPVVPPAGSGNDSFDPDDDIPF